VPTVAAVRRAWICGVMAAPGEVAVVLEANDVDQTSVDLDAEGRWRRAPRRRPPFVLLTVIV
jgi:hypothetical protein